MNYKMTLDYLVRIYGVEILEENIDGDNICIKTTMLYLQFVMTELYTCGYKNFVTTIVDSENVHIRTESVDEK